MNKHINAEIISIGAEILFGYVLNTNAQFISEEFAKLGINVLYQTVVGENAKRLEYTIYNAFSRSDIVITTGGLGPSHNDIAKEICSKYFNKSLIIDKKALDNIQSFFDKMEKSMVKSNFKQAYVPEGSTVLYNNNGTAPGIILEENKKILIMLPGPPKEVIPMFKEYVRPFLESKKEYTFISRVLRVAEIGESRMESLVKDIIEDSKNPIISPYAKDNESILRITATATDNNEANKLIDYISNKIYERLGDNIYAEGDTSIQYTVAKLLLEKNMTISTSESCTGGLLAGTLIDYPGISEVFIDGVVSYSNESKISRLNVKKETLEKYGAVSEQVAKEMAEGIANTSKSNIGVSTTGIAGPDGGSCEKPVGLVYIGVSINGNTIVKRYVFSGNRQRIRNLAVYFALNIIRKELLNI